MKDRQCPKCGKKDLVKDKNYWYICINCKYKIHSDDLSGNDYGEWEENT